MKQIVSFYPSGESDTSVTITATTANGSFPVANLKSIRPTKSWKSTVVTETSVKYDFGGTVAYTALFLNRFNFAEFYVEKSTNDVDWTEVEHVVGATKDEISDENYMHRFVEITGNYRYLRVRIPAQTPLFEPTYFKIGNMLVGNSVQIWNPKAGYTVDEMPKMAMTEYKSGYISTAKLGKTRRTFSGNFDKIKKDEFDKIIKTYQPFVLYHEFDSDKSSAYLVRSTNKYSRDYFMAQILNFRFIFEEIV